MKFLPELYACFWVLIASFVRGFSLGKLIEVVKMRHDVVVILNLYKIGLYGRGKKYGFLWWEVLLVLVPILAEASKYFTGPDQGLAPRMVL